MQPQSIESARLTGEAHETASSAAALILLPSEDQVPRGAIVTWAVLGASAWGTIGAVSWWVSRLVGWAL